METSKVYIRADADKQIGYGHFIRCLALAEILKNDFECYIYTQRPTEFQKSVAKDICVLRELPADDTKFALFLNELNEQEIVVLDNYFFSSDYQKSIKRRGCKLVCFGSNDRHYYSDAIINFTDLPEEAISKEPYSKYYNGLEWSLLRPEFYKISRKSRKSNSIVICIGGTDQYGFAEKFSNFIKTKFPLLSIKVLSTDRIGYERIDNFNRNGISLGINYSARQMSDTFRESEIAIVSASGVALEALSQQTNVIAGYYVDNQIGIYNTLNTNNYIWPIGKFDNGTIYQKIEDSILNIYNQSQTKSIFSPQNTQQLYKRLFHNLCR